MGYSTQIKRAKDVERMGTIMMTLGRVFGIAATLVFVSACGGGGGGSGDSGGGTQPPTSFTVSTSTAGTGSGTLSPTSRSVSQGSTTSFTISPTTGSSIAGVSGCGGSLSGTTYTTGPINGNCTVSATFNLNTYTVTATAGSGGSISPSSVNVTHGGTNAFAVTPSTGQIIDSVGGCGGSLSGNTYTTGPITAACTVTASFRPSGTAPPPSSYTVTTSISGTGTGGITPESVNVIPGGSVTFVLAPSSNSVITSVSGCDGTLSGQTYITGAIARNCTVSVTFDLRTYAVTTLSATGGAIEPAARAVTHGATAQFTILIEDGYSIDDVIGCDGTLVGHTYTTGVIVQACEIRASFTINEYTVTATAGQNGSVSPQTVRVTHGDSAVFTVTPDIGYEVSMAAGCGGSLDDTTFTTAPIVRPCAIEVNFQEISSVGNWTLRVIGVLPGDDFSETNLISADGSTVTGYSYQLPPGGGPVQYHAFRWTQASGLISLRLEGDVFSASTGISADGRTIVGRSCSNLQLNECRAFIWRDGIGIEPLLLPGDDASWTGEVHRLAADGSFTWGYSCNNMLNPVVCRNFIWSESTGIQEFRVNGLPTDARAMSEDGSTIGGYVRDSGRMVAFAWDRRSNEQSFLTIPEAENFISIDRLSADGNVKLGNAGSAQDWVPFIWTDSLVTELVPRNLSLRYYAVSISADGRTVIGEASGIAGPLGAFVWTASGGVEQLIVAGDLFSYAPSSRNTLTDDGATTIANSCDDNQQQKCQIVIWREGVGVRPLIPDPEANVLYYAEEITRSGDKVIGYFNNTNDLGQSIGGGAFVWTETTGVEKLILNSAAGISRDGRIIIGSLDRHAAILIEKN